MTEDALAAASRAVYWICVPCPMCARETRGSQILRAWAKRPKNIFDGSRAIITTSKGPSQIQNTITPLMTYLRELPYRERTEVRRKVEQFFNQIERRMLLTAREAADFATQVRTLY